MNTESRSYLMSLYERLELEKEGIDIDTFLTDPWDVLRKVGMGDILANTNWVKKPKTLC